MGGVSKSSIQVSRYFYPIPIRRSGIEISDMRLLMKTKITELFGIEHPIIQGGMHYVGLAQLAGAVSEAGGLGIITGLTQRTPELLAKEIAHCREMTDKPFEIGRAHV